MQVLTPTKTWGTSASSAPGPAGAWRQRSSPRPGPRSSCWRPALGGLGEVARPAAVKSFLSYSLTWLGLDHLDIYRPAHLDPAVPIEETIGAIADMVKAGYVRAISLSEVGPETVRRALKA